MSLWVGLIVGAIVCGALAAYAAYARGRDEVGWLLLGLVAGPLAILMVLLLPPPPEWEAERRARIAEADERRQARQKG